MLSAPSSWWPRLRAVGVTLAAGGLPVLGVIALGLHGPSIAAWLEAQHPLAAAGVVLLCGAVLCGFALLPTHAVSLASGYVLGAAAGPMVSWCAIMLGAVTCYSGGRLLAGSGIASWCANHRKLGLLHSALVRASTRRTATLVALLRLSPLAPFAATNVALAALGVKAKPFFLGSALGLAPRVVLVAWLGSGMAELDWQSPNAPFLLVAGIIATLAALWMVGHISKRALQRAGESPPDHALSTAANSPR